jgi:hypothetical protein
MSGRKEKSTILNEFTATTGYDRKYAIRRLNQIKNGLPPTPVKRTRKRLYGQDVEDVLLVVWQAANQVPVRTFADWQDNRPGFVEADLVAHCGNRAEGAYLNTLVLTDVATAWTECLPLLYRSES